ncbi:MAG TPA: hypothetical protein VFT06_10335 [Flavisolibacter sp.]|nr:hypothetical protein [Flavisolibacter sp.]
MTLELYINGHLHDTITRRWSKEEAAAALKERNWYLLNRTNWQIFEVRDSRMNIPKFLLEQTF